MLINGNPLLVPNASPAAGLHGFFHWLSPKRILRTRRAKQRFYQLAGNDELISYEEWEHALGLHNPMIAKRLFELVDTDASGFIDVQEYLVFVECLANSRSDQRYHLLFAIYDQDNDGELQLRDIQHLLSASMEEQSLKVGDKDLTELSRSFLRYFEIANRNTLDASDFVRRIREFSKTDRLFQQFASHWVAGRNKIRSDRGVLRMGVFARNARYFQLHWKSWFWVAIYLLVNEYLIADAMARYASSGAVLAVQIARGLGACLNLNAALILVLMSRALWSSLRHTFLARVLPLDSLTDFHRRVGWILLIMSVAHTVAHVYNYWDVQTDLYSLLTDLPFITGVTATLAFLLLLTGVAYHGTRRREMFSLLHPAYAIFLVSVLFHGTQFWMWLATPMVIYGLDALYRRLAKTRRVQVLALEPLSDGVTRIRFAKPRRFRFYPGDYVLLRLPSLSRWQWHPFTISAAPESEYFDLHVRINGNWSGALHNLSRKSNVGVETLVANIDGPYGATTTNIKHSTIAVMVAAGIGVTPFASVLESLVMQRLIQSEAASRPGRMLYFHWLNRSQASYEWFQQLLSQAETTLADQFQLYIHLTSFNHNLTNIAMQIAVEEFYKKHQRDPFTRLQAITSPGRPNWPSTFTDLRTKHGNQPIDVFYCGPKELGRDLKRHCYNFGFHFYTERFD